MLRDDLGDLDARLRRLMPVTEPERLTSGARWGLHPTTSPDGRRLAYTRSDGRSDIQLRVRDMASGEDRSVGRTNGLATFSWLRDDALLVSQLELDDPYRLFGDLYVFGLGGAQRRLTHGARLGQPSVLPDGTSAIAVEEGGGTNALVRVDLETGEVTRLVEPRPDAHWAFPSISPDGRWIAATLWLPDANHDVVVLDARSGAVAAEVTRDRAIDMGPRWSPDGRWLVWASDRTGILNILGAEIDPATGAAEAPRMLTNVRTGAAYPSVDASGTWLYFSGYHADGWEVERVPFRTRGRPAAPPPDPRFAEPGGESTRGVLDGEVRSPPSPRRSGSCRTRGASRPRRSRRTTSSCDVVSSWDRASAPRRPVVTSWAGTPIRRTPGRAPAAPRSRAVPDTRFGDWAIPSCR
jgi:hypothetical protein